jgi:hypothetical protein
VDLLQVVAIMVGLWVCGGYGFEWICCRWWWLWWVCGGKGLSGFVAGGESPA